MFKRLKSTVGRQLKLGLTVPACQRAMGLSATIGLFPIMGVSTPFVILIAYLTRLNQPVILAVNFSIGPLKLLLIYPFLRLGEYIFSAQPLPINLTQLTERFVLDWLGTLQEFGNSFFYASFGWLICAPFLYFIFYKISSLIIPRIHSFYQSQIESFKK